jgi:hypothetical protein
VTIGSRRFFLLLLSASAALAGCNLIAGLGDFQPPSASATSSTGTGGEGVGGLGGAGGTSATTSGKTSSSSGQPSSTVTTGPGGGACATHLLINEVRVQNGDFVELYNPTNAQISVTGYTLSARTSSNQLGLKWTGKGGQVVPAKSYFLLTQDASGDDTISSGIVSDDPTVVVLKDSGDLVVDSMCVCDTSACSFPDGATDYCAGRALVAPSFHVANDLDSAQRLSCSDTDDEAVDFALGCPTPHAQNFSIATCL